MTVCVAVCIDDGIVFAADSASTMLATDMSTGASAVHNVYRHGNKVFNLCRGLPVVAMTAGMGAIGRVPIHALAKDLRLILKDELEPTSYTIKGIADRARAFLFEERFRKLESPPPAPHVFEFLDRGAVRRDRAARAVENPNCQR